MARKIKLKTQDGNKGVSEQKMYEMMEILYKRNGRKKKPTKCTRNIYNHIEFFGEFL
jgi:hypothetical protein